jgi:hypothetical protein
MTPRQPEPAGPDVLLALVRIARRLLDAWPEGSPVPRELEGAWSTFYHLADAHGITPAPIRVLPPEPS